MSRTPAIGRLHYMSKHSNNLFVENMWVQSRLVEGRVVVTTV
jgi:hypothetical protein